MNPFYFLFYIIYKLLMRQFKSDDGSEDMPGRVMGLISLMMIFPLGSSYISSLTALRLTKQPT